MRREEGEEEERGDSFTVPLRPFSSASRYDYLQPEGVCGGWGGDTHGGSRRHILRAASAAERWIYGAARVVAAIYLFEVFFVC